MGNTVNFTINFNGNAEAFTNGLLNVTGKLKGQMDTLSTTFGKFKANLIVFQQASQLAQSFGETLKGTAEPGLKLNTSLHELSAITGVTGEKLKEIEGYARETAKTFGGSAAQSVESYKLILSQLSPEIAKVPAALSSMGDSIATLSKTMGGNVAGATEVLTTAMNQFQVSTKDPIKAAGEMQRMMNVMAAAAQQGSAELPAISAALQQSGMAAKGANVSFAETNAAIQLLDKAGKKASEGGVALRNVLATLAQGRFLPKDVQQELTAAGVSMNKLTDNSLSLADRLSALSPIANDAALMTKLFGKENANAANALMAGIGQMREWTSAISDTNSAEEQAAIIMQSREEQMARYRAKIDDLKISFFDLTGSLLPFAEIMTSALVPISQMMPLIISLGSGLKMLGSTAVIGSIKTCIAAIGSYGLSLVTTGTTSAAFAATSVASFAAIKVAAIASCKAIGVAIMNIPIIGWIAAALAALGAATVWAYNKFEGFRKVVLGSWEVIKGFGQTMKEMFIETIKSVLNGLGSLGSAIANLFKGNFKQAALDAKNGLTELFKASPVGIMVKATVKTVGRVQDDYNKGAAKAVMQEQKDDVQEINDEISAIIASAGKQPVINIIDPDKAQKASDTLASLPSKLDAIKLKNKLVGDSQTALKEQIQTVTSAITSLTELGYSEQSKEISGLVNKLISLKLEQRELIGNTRTQIALNKIAEDQRKRLSGINNPLKGSIKTSSPLDNNMTQSFNVLDSANVNKDNSFKLFQVYGDKMAYVGQMADITRNSIQDLLKIGYDPHSAQIQGLIKELKGYDKVLGNLTPKQNNLLSGLGNIGSMMQSISGVIGEGAGKWLQWGANLLNVISQAIPAIMGLIGIKATETAITQADTNAKVANAAAGAMSAHAGIPFAGVALGLAAVGSIIGAMMSIPKFANGAIVSGPTMALVGEYAGASNNPEVIAPLNKLRSLIQPSGIGGDVRFEIGVDKLVGLLKKYDKSRRYM